MQLANGQVGGPILMESGMRHGKVNQSTRSHHCRCINERSHTASPLLLLPCTAASSLLACWFGPCRRNPNSSSKEQLGFRCGQEITRERDMPIDLPRFGFGYELQPFLQPSASRAAWRIRAPHHLVSRYGAMSGPWFFKNSLRNRALSTSWHCPPSPRPRCRNHYSGPQQQFLWAPVCEPGALLSSPYIHHD